ncbi:hypothetical protein GCM10009571_11960 [Agromyces luteolus]|uniref:sigma-70 family RNA polymerase sigma factor n=2 Tax=Agromyces luteolus TaxID=88373 RepID=UPI0014124BEF
MTPARSTPADADLIAAARSGDRDAYAELWRRHEASARTVARSHTTLDADDLVAEAFTRTYDAIRSGKGPTGAFRPYLFTTIRNTAATWGRANRETPLDDLESVEDPTTGDAAALEALDRSTTAKAFRALPERWQEVLWYAEVERMSPQQIAPLLGMSANATAALAYRAREGLRQQWIRAHLADGHLEPECGWTVDRLGAYLRGRLRSRDTAKVEAHLDDCAKCTVVAAEAREVGMRLALVLLPLAAGSAAATAYSAWLGAAAPVATTAAGAAGLTAVGGAGQVGGAAAGTAAAGASTASGTGAAVAVGAGVGGAVLVAATAVALLVLPQVAPTDAAPGPGSAAIAAEDPREPEPPQVATVPDAAPAPREPEPAPDPVVPPAQPEPAVEPEPRTKTTTATVVEPEPVPEPEPEPEPVVEPEPEPVAELGLVVDVHGSALTLSLEGEPGAEVELLADGLPFAIVVLDESGLAVAEFLAPANHKWTASARYA